MNIIPEWPSLSLAGHICNCFRYDDFMLVIIYGRLRSGKSIYSMKVLDEVMNYFYGERLSPKMIDEFVGFHPQDVIENWMQIDKRIPMYIWDDAGYWLYSMDWNNPLLKAIQKYFNVIGTDMNCIVLTTPDPTWILSKLVNMPGTYRGRIIKTSKTSRWARNCRGYEPWRAPDLKKTGVNPYWDDDYSCKLRQDLYDYYYPIRKSYARQAKMLIKDTLLKRKQKEQEKEIKEAVKNLNYLADK